MKKNKNCNICDLAIHEANLKKVGESYFHYLCWERFDEKITDKTKKELKKFKRKAMIKSMVISVILNFFIWWIFLEIARKIINNWR